MQYAPRQYGTTHQKVYPINTLAPPPIMYPPMPGYSQYRPSMPDYGHYRQPGPFNSMRAPPMPPPMDYPHMRQREDEYMPYAYGNQNPINSYNPYPKQRNMSQPPQQQQMQMQQQQKPITPKSPNMAPRAPRAHYRPPEKPDLASIYVPPDIDRQPSLEELHYEKNITTGRPRMVRIRTPSNWNMSRPTSPFEIRESLSTGERYQLVSMKSRTSLDFQPYSHQEYRNIHSRDKYMTLPGSLGHSETDSWKQEVLLLLTRLRNENV
jgi:hypothetical protein